MAARRPRVDNLLDSYIYGFALQEATLPFSTPEEMAELSEQMLAAVADAYPNLARVQRELVGSGFVYADQFEAGLDFIPGLATGSGQNRQRVWLNVSPFVNPKALRARTS